MTGWIRWENLKREATQGRGIDRALVGLYEQGYRNGVEAVLDSLSQLLVSMADGAEQSGTMGDLTYASGLRDAATLVQRTLEQRRKEWSDADAE